MRQTFLRFKVVFVVVPCLFLASLVAQAMTPTLSVSATGNGDSVAVTVYGDANTSVVLYSQYQYSNSGYNYGSSPQQYIGTTNSNGYLSVTLSSATNGIAAGSTVYVVVNNQTSASVTWPYSYNNYNNGYSGSLTLSPTSVSVTVGQSVDVTIYGGNMPYTMYPSGTNIFQPALSGNKLQVTGLTNGSGSINVCSSGGTSSGCVVLYVTVSSANYYGGNNYYAPPIYNNPIQPTLTFSQNNPAISVGQTLAIAVSGLTPYSYYGGSYNVAYNSNPGGLSAVLSGSTLTLQGLAVGNTSVVVCLSVTNCSALNVSVAGLGYNNNYNNSSNWVSCANENQSCSFSGTRTVQYGANGVYVYRTVTNGTICSNAVFGDPIFGVAKRCSISGY